MRCHDLRHTAATLQLAADVPLTTISRTLGHSTLAATADIYPIVAQDLGRQAADAMDRSLSGGASWRRRAGPSGGQ